jgi:hypothetical protein
MRFRRPGGKAAKLTLGPVDLTNSNHTPEDFALGMPLGLVAARQFALKVNRERAMGRDVHAEYHADKQRRRQRSSDMSREGDDTRRTVLSIRSFISRNDVADVDGVSVVYFAAVGKSAVKIGFSTDVEERLQTFRQWFRFERIALLAALPGSKKLERQIHRALASARISGEFFRTDAVMDFLTNLGRASLTSSG